jgi:hypothetical protein
MRGRACWWSTGRVLKDVVRDSLSERPGAVIGNALGVVLVGVTLVEALGGVVGIMLGLVLLALHWAKHLTKNKEMRWESTPVSRLLGSTQDDGSEELV